MIVWAKPSADCPSYLLDGYWSAHDLRLVRSNGLTRILACTPNLPCTAGTCPSGFEIALFPDMDLLRICEGEPNCTPQGVLDRLNARPVPSIEAVLADVPPRRARPCPSSSHAAPQGARE